MRLSRLQLQNFRQHRLSDLTFDSGLTGIIGPNGAGKSTLLEAIAWALYGNAAARGTREGIRFLRAQPRATVKVELEFELTGHRYRIVRGLTSAELFLDNAPDPIANSITAVTEAIHRRLGMTRSEFFNTYFTGQKELSVMAAMKPTERAQFLSRVLGYEKLRVAQELARDKRRLITAEMAGVRTGMRDPEAVARLVADARARVAETKRKYEAAEQVRIECDAHFIALTPRWANAQQQRDRLQEVLAELRVAESDETGRKRDADRITRELEEIRTASAELADVAIALASMGAIADEFEHLENLARQEGRRRALDESIRAGDEELARLRERLDKLESAPTEVADLTQILSDSRVSLETAVAQFEERRTEWVRDKQEAETRRQALRSQYAELREQRDKLASLGGSGACPTCLRPLEDTFRTVIDMLDNQMETVAVDGNYYKARLEQLQEMPEEVRVLDDKRREVFQDVAGLERRLASAQHAVNESVQLSREYATKQTRVTNMRQEFDSLPGGYNAVRHDELRAEADRLARLESSAARLGALIEKEPQLLEEKRQAEQTLQALSERLAQLRVRRAEFGTVERDYVQLRTAYEFAATQLHQAEVAAAAAQGEAVAATDLLQVAERERDEVSRAEAQLRILQLQRRLHDELDRAFSDLRTDLNFQLRPELSELASSFLRDLTDGRYTELELDDEYRIIVLEDGQPKPVISGGEEDLANLSLRLAISQMIAERSGQTFSLLVLDEVFGSLDESRRRNVLELLRRVRDRFEQVILITHVDSVKEGLDQVISVAYDEETGAAVVSGAENPAGDGLLQETNASRSHFEDQLEAEVM